MIEAIRAPSVPTATRAWAPGAVVEGRVGAMLAHGAVALLTPLGALPVRGLPALPAGTIVTLRLPEHATEPVSLLSARAPASPSGANAQAAASLDAFESPRLLRAWPALDAALARAPAAAARLVANPDATLPARILDAQGPRAAGVAGLSALLDALSKRGEAALAAQLAGDWNALAAVAREAAPEDWTLSVVPFLAAGALQQMRVFVHRAKDGRTRDDVRFAIELDQSPYGALRLEGLTRGERIDLCLSAERPVPDNVADDLRALVRRTLAHLGHGGALSIPAPAPLYSMARPPIGAGLLA